MHTSLGELVKNWDSLPDGYIPVPFAEDRFKGIIEEPSSYPSAINGADDNDLERCRWILQRNSAGHPVEAGQQHSSIEPSVGHEDIEQTMFGGALSMTTQLTELAGGEDDSHDFMDEQIEIDQINTRPDYTSIKTKLCKSIWPIAEGDREIEEYLDSSLDRLLVECLGMKSKKQQRNATLISILPETDNRRKSTRLGRYVN